MLRRDECICGDDRCPVATMMTLKDFEMHRPRLAKSLTAFAAGWTVVTILPEYDENQLFSAMLRDAEGFDRIAVCVSGVHEKAMVDENTPGQSTWIWEEDL